MNLLGIKCTVLDGKGQILALVSLEGNGRHLFKYKSPSIFSFKRNSGEILNWHRDNLLSLITQFNIKGIVVKKSEREAFANHRITNADIFKLNLEGVMLSMAGSLGILNRHFYKTDIGTIFENPQVWSNSLEEIMNEHEIENDILQGTLAAERAHIQELILAVIAFERTIE